MFVQRRWQGYVELQRSQSKVVLQMRDARQNKLT